jgi:hypothetical protein
MFNVTILPNGDLKLTASNEGRKELAEWFALDRNYWTMMADIFEPYSSNGSYEPFDGGDGNPFVGLTSAPCIAESLDTDDDGNREVIGNFWYYNDYCITDDMEELKNKGYVIYTLAR